jgi:hypothetical protein
MVPYTEAELLIDCWLHYVFEVKREHKLENTTVIFFASYDEVVLCSHHGFLLIACINSELIMTLREEHRLMIFKSRMLKKLFGLKRDEGTGEWKRLQNEELYDRYSTNITCLCDQAKENEMGETCGKYGRRDVHAGFWWEDLM